MVELSTERVDEILHKETQRTDELATILRSIYTRYMRLYETYFADIDALNDEKIAELKTYHEETESLVKYYYMDIPLDICMKLKVFDDEHITEQLGSDWHEHLLNSYKEFKAEYEGEDKSEECLKAKFAEEELTDFYEAMDEVFREGFGTGSRAPEGFFTRLRHLIFGEPEQPAGIPAGAVPAGAVPAGAVGAQYRP
jgi:hypothetical protein